MPGTANPTAKEFYTYRFFANNRTFYVGKGHWVEGKKIQRVSDRGLWASRHRDWKSKDVQVLNLLHFKYKTEVRWAFLGKKDLTEIEAKAQEKRYMKRYLDEKCFLANHVGNPEKRTVGQVIAWILSGDSTPSRVGKVLEFKD